MKQPSKLSCGRYHWTPFYFRYPDGMHGSATVNSDIRQRYCACLRLIPSAFRQPVKVMRACYLLGGPWHMSLLKAWMLPTITVDSPGTSFPGTLGHPWAAETIMEVFGLQSSIYYSPTEDKHHEPTETIWVTHLDYAESSPPFLITESLSLRSHWGLFFFSF